MKQHPFSPCSLSSLSDALQLCLFQQQGSQDSLGSPFTLLFLKGWSGNTRPVSLDSHAHTHSSVKPCGWFSWKRKCWLKSLLLCLPSTEQRQSWSQRSPSCSLSWAWCRGQDWMHTWGLLSWRLQSRRTATAQLLVQAYIQSMQSTVHRE